jgi:4-hydroxybenzoyl-CoA thioesterase
VTALAVQRPAPLAPADLPAAAFVDEQRVRFEECDPAGIVFFARWFEMMNRAVEDWFTGALGLDYNALIRDGRIGLGYAHSSCDFLRPGLMGDRLRFTVLVERLGRGSITLLLHGHRGEEQVIRGRLVIATTSLETHAAIPVPAAIRQAVEAYQRRCTA